MICDVLVQCRFTDRVITCGLRGERHHHKLSRHNARTAAIEYAVPAGYTLQLLERVLKKTAVLVLQVNSKSKTDYLLYLASVRCSTIAIWKELNIDFITGSYER